MSRRSTRPRVLGWAAGVLRGQDMFFEILDILHRGMRLRCPCCGHGRLFKSALRTYDRCQACDERFEREPGQSFGAVYVNLGLSGLLTLTAYLMTTTLFSLTMPQPVILADLEEVISDDPTPGMMSGRRENIVLSEDCDEDGQMLEDVELMFIMHRPLPGELQENDVPVKWNRIR